jgi:hypothetical protein
MSRITIPANPGFYRLELWKAGRIVTRSPVIGWRIYDTEDPRAVCVGIEVKDSGDVLTGILTPDGKVYYAFACYGEDGSSESEWIDRATDHWDATAERRADGQVIGSGRPKFMVEAGK